MSFLLKTITFLFTLQSFICLAEDYSVSQFKENKGDYPTTQNITKFLGAQRVQGSKNQAQSLKVNNTHSKTHYSDIEVKQILNTMFDKASHNYADALAPIEILGWMLAYITAFLTILGTILSIILTRKNINLRKQQDKLFKNNEDLTNKIKKQIEDNTQIAVQISVNDYIEKMSGSFANYAQQKISQIEQDLSSIFVDIELVSISATDSLGKALKVENMFALKKALTLLLSTGEDSGGKFSQGIIELEQLDFRILQGKETILIEKIISFNTSLRDAVGIDPSLKDRLEQIKKDKFIISG
jgi:hypothetical protein